MGLNLANPELFAILMTFLIHNPVPVADKEFFCLIEAIHYESNGEGYEGKKAVANIIMRRKQIPVRFPNTICGVVHERAAFEYRFDPNKRIEKIKLQNNLDRISFRDTLIISYKAVTGTLQDNTGGADHFYNPRVANPDWSHPDYVTVEINNHRFVKLHQ